MLWCSTARGSNSRRQGKNHTRHEGSDDKGLKAKSSNRDAECCRGFIANGHSIQQWRFEKGSGRAGNWD